MPDEDLLPADAQVGFELPFTLPQVELTEDEPDPFATIETDMDPRVRQDFTGLLYVGRLEEECKVAGHRFLLRSPSQDDRLEMGPVHKPYVNTATMENAWRTITVSAYLRRIDSEVAPEPLGPGVGAVRTRFDWMRASIYSSAVIDILYQNCLELGARVDAVISSLDSLGEASA